MLNVISFINTFLIYFVVFYFNAICIVVTLCNLWHAYFYMSQQYKGWVFAILPFGHCFLEEKYIFSSKWTLVLYIVLSIWNLFIPNIVTVALWLGISIMRLRQVIMAESVVFSNWRKANESNAAR